MPSTEPARLILVTGIMASGKTSVAQRLAESFTRSVHLHGDAFRTMIVNGRVERQVPPSDEAMRQIELRYRIAADAIDRYLAAGFSVVYQDVIIGESLRSVVESLARHPLHVVVLCPRADVVHARDRSRHKRAYTNADAAHFDRVLRRGTPRIGLWIDSSELEVDDTAACILERLDRSRVTSADLR
jgi:predicted kinase